MPNIFTMSPFMCLEDRFTLYWEYLLYHNLDLGQQIVDYIADQTGIQKSKYIGCQDHPFFNGVDLPDLLIKCEDYDLICEHKIDSPLGHRQLQRYCELETEKSSYVILISNSSETFIEQEVFDYPRYLKPNNSSCNYFLWENFYPIIKDHPSHIAHEFCEYMESEGMAAWNYGEWGDPFSDEEAKTQFKKIWQPVIQYFKKCNPPAKVCKVDPIGFGLQVQRPTPEIRLIYFHVSKKPLDFTTGLSGRGLNMKVYGHRDSNDLICRLPQIEETLPTLEDKPDYHVRSIGKQEPDSSGYVLLREYALSLDYILTPDITLAKERLVEFVATCKKHLEETIENT